MERNLNQITRSAPEKRYHRYQLILSLSQFIIGVVFILILVLSGFSLKIENVICTWISNDYLVLIVFMAVIGLAESLLMFPLSFISGFVLERRFNLSDQSFGGWIWERFKGILVGGPIAVILLVIFYAVLKRFPAFWWLIMGTVMLFFSIVLARLAPVLIFPLFYKFDKLKNAELSDRVSSLCQMVGMKVEGVYQFNLSKSTKKGNAAFTGIGRSKRVILGDTLLEKLLPDEILAILSHELGHFKLKHIWKSMAIGIVLTYTGLFLVSVIYRSLYQMLGFENPWQIAALPLIALLLTVYQFITGPLQNIYSRSNERAADDFAVGLMGNSALLISGLNKLSDQNLADRTPNPVVEFLFYSHPSVNKRIKRLQV